MVATTAVTAALILLAGCGGDKKSDSGSNNNNSNSTTSASPTAPSIPTFDPPKAFAIGAAYPVLKDTNDLTVVEHADVALVGHVAVASNKKALNGHDVTDPNKSWSLQATPATTTTVNAVLPPRAVKLDGKDAAVVIYSETDKGNGTQKPQGLVVIRWVDVATGEAIAETKTKTLDDKGGAGGAVYDIETGQVALGINGPPDSNGSTTSALYADPATKKTAIVPGLDPAAVHNGTIAGATWPSSYRANDSMLALADGPSGKITKKLGHPQTSYDKIAGTGKHGYFYGKTYVTAKDKWDLGIYSVDLSTGAVAVTPLPPSNSSTDIAAWSCLWDEASTIACTGKTTYTTNGTDTMLGFDDSTGKKAWGFSNDSGNRNVPDLTAAYHGVLYAQTEAQNVLLDAKTGADLPSPTPSGSPSSSDSPSAGSTPSDGSSPTAGDTPSDGSTPGTNPNSNLALFDGKLKAPTSVSQYGGVYSQGDPNNDYDSSNDLDSVCVFLKATA
ncbi:hypothetical protein ACQHIV_32080 [Kribbella sp. GL6]|uniref:hypothetical protein n=1 Tax=Kribbella sp. GL6 TaxID=3419765 RepID=UPI003D03F561